MWQFSVFQTDTVTLYNTERIILCCVFPTAASTFLLCIVTMPAHRSLLGRNAFRRLSLHHQYVF